PRLLPYDQLLLQRFCERGEGPVVRRRPKPAADEDVGDFGVVQVAPQLLDDLGRTVADLGDPFGGIAQQAQPLGQPVGVGVEREPADQLVADGHDARRWHWTTIYTWSGCTPWSTVTCRGSGFATSCSARRSRSAFRGGSATTTTAPSRLSLKAAVSSSRT